MVAEGEYQRVYHVGRPAHTLRTRLAIIEFRTVFRYQNTYHNRTHEGDQHTGGRMKAWCIGEIVERQPCKKSQYQQCGPRQLEGKPKQKQVIQDGNDVLMQKGNPV